MAQAMTRVVDTIDLTSSPEPDISPGKAARAALQHFQPRSNKKDADKDSSFIGVPRRENSFPEVPLPPVVRSGWRAEPIEQYNGSTNTSATLSLNGNGFYDVDAMQGIRTLNGTDGHAAHVEYELPESFRKREVRQLETSPSHQRRTATTTVPPNSTTSNNFDPRPSKRQRMADEGIPLAARSLDSRKRSPPSSSLQPVNAVPHISSEPQSVERHARVDVPARSGRKRMSAAASLRSSLNEERQNLPNGRSPPNYSRESAELKGVQQINPLSRQRSRDSMSTLDPLSSKSDSEKRMRAAIDARKFQKEPPFLDRDIKPHMRNASLTPELRSGLAKTDGNTHQPSQAQPQATPPVVTGPAVPTALAKTSNHGVPYTLEEDQLLWDLKTHQNVSWNDMPSYFNGRTQGSLQTRFSSVVRPKFAQTITRPVMSRPNPELPDILWDGNKIDTVVARQQKRRRNNEVSTVDGFVSWAEVKRRRLDEDVVQPNTISQASARSDAQFTGERAFPRSIIRLLRDRALGRGDHSSTQAPSIPRQMKEHVFDSIGPRKFFKGTSSDVTCLAWAPDGRHFAAGSIAITDDRSMQYNKPNNLLLGDFERSTLVELPEHHIARPVVESPSNINGLQSMRESQDPRLFMTVAAVQFSPDSSTLYTAGSDRYVRAYRFQDGVERASCAYRLEHAAILDLLSVSNNGLLATACHLATDDSVNVFDGPNMCLSLSPLRQDIQTSRPIYPSALRWGAAYQHSNLLLAGFSIDGYDEERDIAGETCLWDLTAGTRLEIHAVTRNVFDVAWNPSSTSSSHAFAVASTPGTSKVNRKTRSVVQCFAPNQGRASRVLELECPAFDINDVIYCPYDDRYIAAGATDGKVYIWDQRFANPRHMPLHVLEHGESLNVLDHDKDYELADTGIRFLSWGATRSRLYSGSSDGVVKIWNPYMATYNAHIKDVATFSSAVMSGAFSPDYRELLIGEDQGRLNLLSVGFGEKTVRTMDPFDMIPAPAPVQPNKSGLEAAQELLNTGQIEIRRMGALPKGQAVQGPNYSGPYLAPNDSEISEADLSLKAAQDVQAEAHLQVSMVSTQDSERDEAVRNADQRVGQAQQLVYSLKSRLEDTKQLEPMAERLQRDLHDAHRRQKKCKKEAQRLAHDTRSCQLKCDYLPAYTDEDGAPDNLRSVDRIPTSLWPAKDLDISTATPEDILEAGLTSKCMTCFGPASKPHRGKRAQCANCVRKANGLIASCIQCKAPTRVLQGESKDNVCERCGFGCLRCGKPALLAEDATEVACFEDDCGGRWKIAALGYEMVPGSDRRVSLQDGKNAGDGQPSTKRAPCFDVLDQLAVD